MATLVNGSHTHCHARGILEKRNPHFNKHLCPPPLHPHLECSNGFSAAASFGAVVQFVSPKLLLCSLMKNADTADKGNSPEGCSGVTWVLWWIIPHWGFPHPFLPTAGYWGIYLGSCLVRSRLAAFKDSWTTQDFGEFLITLQEERNKGINDYD